MINSIIYAGTVATINFTCNDSNPGRWEIFDGPVTILIGLVSTPSYTSSQAYDLGALPSKTLKLTCTNISNGLYDSKTINLTNPVGGPAVFNKVSIYPTEQVCGGGRVTLSWDIKDALGKNCKVTATKLNPLSIHYTDAAIAQVNDKIITAVYKNGSSLSTRSQVFETPGINKGSMSGVDVKYSTRFTINCGGAPTLAPPSNKAVDVRVTCRGEE